MMISISHLTKIYPGTKTPSVEKISLNVKKGEVFGFLGPNGAGKTTTVKMMMGLMRPTSGKISILDSTPEDFRVKTKIGFLPENPYFYQYLTAVEFLEMCANIFGIPRVKIQKKIGESLLSVHLKKEAWNTKIRTYSKGMQQRLGLAQALINNPELVVLDEPMAGLDPLGRKEVKDIILNLKKNGKTVFFNSHILSDVEDLCDHAAIIDRGKIILDDTVKVITKNYTIPLEEVFVSIITQKRT
ncbi:ABC transporter ATP-binding protein [Candidatus Peregrinibacteria bacterium]|nr:ABC transporter ATP-binding protein [Candidatus Peregrinibacteria bacterium]